MAKIQVIDDEPLVRLTLRRVLEPEGHEIVEAVDGRAGVAQFERERPALVITDILMPYKEGIQTIREILKLVPDQPIIAMSGGGRLKYMEFLDAARAAGALEIVRKPFEPATILDAVKRLLA